jgi:hypothetical protein
MTCYYHSRPECVKTGDRAEELVQPLIFIFKCGLSASKHVVMRCLDLCLR